MGGSVKRRYLDCRTLPDILNMNRLALPSSSLVHRDAEHPVKPSAETALFEPTSESGSHRRNPPSPRTIICIIRALVAYDCFYLALAIERECVLVTGDRGLASSARAIGLETHVRLLGA